MSSSFDLVDTRLFVHVADLASVTKGAAACHISAPAASVRIRNLEKSFGLKLLERTRNGVIPTLAGRAFLQHARLLLEQVEALHAELRGHAHGMKGNLRIAANSPAMSETLPTVISRYMKMHPEISIDLRTKLNSEVIRAVSENSADIGLCAGEFTADGLEIRPYLEDRFALIVSVEHPLAATECLFLAEALAYEIIGFPENSAANAFLRGVADAAGSSPKMSILVENYDTLFRMIEANVGVGIISECAARRYARNAPIRIIPLKDDSAARNLCVCSRSFDALPGFARNFLDILFEQSH